MSAESPSWFVDSKISISVIKEATHLIEKLTPGNHACKLTLLRENQSCQQAIFLKNSSNFLTQMRGFNLKIV